MLVPCQVRINTENPCPHRAVVEMRGIAFCGSCAREQEAYFAIGELTQEKRSLRSRPLTEALEKMRRERAGGRGGTATEMHYGLPGVDRIECLGLT